MEKYYMDEKIFEEASYFGLLVRKALMCAVDETADYRLLYTIQPNGKDVFIRDISCSGVEELIEKGYEFLRHYKDEVYLKDVECQTDSAARGKVNALRVYVYRDYLGDCTNGGISARYDELLMYHPEGPCEIDLNDIPENFAVLEKRILFGEEADFIRPLIDVPDGMVGWMSGGNIAYTSDSRFHRHPLLIHDRAEKPL